MPDPRSRIFRRPIPPALRTREFGLFVLLLLLLALVTAIDPPFGGPSHLATMLDDTALLILLATGEAVVLLTRGVDLSVAANAALTGMIVALLDQAHPHVGVPAVLALSVVLGTVLGAANGLLVWLLRMPPIVVTLGTLSVFRGAVYLASGGTWVNSGVMSPDFLGFPRTHLLGLSTLSWIAVLVAALVALWLRHAVSGRTLYAAGNDPDAAPYAGVDVGRAQLVAFCISGAIAGLSGFLWVSRFAVAYTDIAGGFELSVIAACVIGGISISGGVGTVAGVVLGALFLGLIRNALPLVGISPFWQGAVSGLVITAAVVLNAGGRGAARRTPILEQPAS